MRIVLLESDRTAIIRDIGQARIEAPIEVGIYPECDGVLSIGNNHIPFYRGYVSIPSNKIGDGLNEIELKVGNALYRCTPIIRSGNTIQAAYDANELALRDAIEIQRIWAEINVIQTKIAKLETKYGIQIIK